MASLDSYTCDKCKEIFTDLNVVMKHLNKCTGDLDCQESSVKEEYNNSTSFSELGGSQSHESTVSEDINAYNHCSEQDGVQSQESYMTEQFNTSTHFADYDAVLRLIECYGDFKEDFNEGKRKKIDIWKDISKILHSHGYKYSAVACDAKMRGLKKSYRKIRGCTRLSGRKNVKQWPYYSAMDKIFRKDPATTPISVEGSLLAGDLDCQESSVKEECNNLTSLSKQGGRQSQESIVMEDCNTYNHCSEEAGVQSQESYEAEINNCTSFSEKAAVLLLIECYGDFKEDFNVGKRKKIDIWKDISNILHLHDYKYSAEACDIKMRGLKASYKKIKDRSRSTGRRNVKQWPYYSAMDKIFRKDPATTPISVEGSLLGVSEVESVVFYPQSASPSLTSVPMASTSQQGSFHRTRKRVNSAADTQSPKRAKSYIERTQVLERFLHKMRKQNKKYFKNHQLFVVAQNEHKVTIVEVEKRNFEQQETHRRELKELSDLMAERQEKYFSQILNLTEKHHEQVAELHQQNAEMQRQNLELQRLILQRLGGEK